MNTAWTEVRVVNRWREATNIVCIEFAAYSGEPLEPMAAGAHIDVEVAPGLIRQYSLCQPDHANGVYQIGVLREAASRGGSQFLAETIGVGDRLRISKARNQFGLEPGASHSILIAGGIGITPILAMADALWRDGQSFELHYGSKSRDNAAFVERINASGYASKVKWAFDKEGESLNLAAILSAPVNGAHVYVCGPAGLITATLDVARLKGWPDDQVHREYFAAPTEPSESGQVFRVKVATSGLEFEIPEGHSIAAVLTASGVNVPVSCEQGVCGTCLTKVLSGRPDHRDFYLTPDEQARGDQMLLCCSRSKDELLILDL